MPPTIEEKILLETLKQNPTLTKILEGDTVKKLFATPEDTEDEGKEESEGDEVDE